VEDTPAGRASGSNTSVSRWHVHRRLYDWVLHWADTPYGTPALAVLSFAESSFFPIPPDPLLGALCVGRPKRSLWFALVCSLASIAGGVCGYLIGWLLTPVGRWIVGRLVALNMCPEQVTTEAGPVPLWEFLEVKFQANTFWAVFTAGLTPIPYKVFTIAAGAFRTSLLEFFAASVLARSLRFLAEGALVRVFGPPIRAWVEKYFNWACILFVLLLLGGFLTVKYVI
jgi:membrane protein YqaA with SNARE-associated domain